jgi:CRISPR-associated endonuclease/helicase Cas3
LPIRNQVEVTPKEIEAFFEAAPAHTSEVLETDTYYVLDWLVGRAKTFAENQPFAFVLTQAGDFQRSLAPVDLRFDDADKDVNKKRKEKLTKLLCSKMLVVDARLRGLRDGLLDASMNETPRTADDGQDWLPLVDGEPVVRFRIRATESETGGYRPTHPQWRYSHRFLTSNPDQDETKDWLIVEKWQSDSATEDDRAVGHCQLLEDHQRLAETRARELAKRLNLPAVYSEMLAITARLHDEGKRATRWQLAFNAPTPGAYAKTLGPINFALLDGYRHEFSSLEVAARDAELLKLPRELQDLALHLIAAHHGFARPIIGITGCEDAPPSRLEGRAREVALRFARLQQLWGPWGLAWWESLLRSVDQQASRENDASDVEISQEASA